MLSGGDARDALAVRESSSCTIDGDGFLEAIGGSNSAEIGGGYGDNRSVYPKYVTVVRGSTIVKLSSEFTRILVVGRHTISIVSMTDTATGEFFITITPIHRYRKSTGIRPRNCSTYGCFTLMQTTKTQNSDK